MDKNRPYNGALWLLPLQTAAAERRASQVLATESDEAAGRTDYVVTRWYRAPEAIGAHVTSVDLAMSEWRLL